MIVYDNSTKALPNAQLEQLFVKVGWCKVDNGNHSEHFNKPFVNSTLVISAWHGEQLVGTVRVISDTIIRSIIYDVAVDPAFQGNGIGRELVRRCVASVPNSEWLVGTERKTIAFYEKCGFTLAFADVNNGDGVFLRIAGKYC